MSFVITSPNEYVLNTDTSTTEGTGEGQQYQLDATPRVTITGGNARLLNA